MKSTRKVSTGPNAKQHRGSAEEPSAMEYKAKMFKGAKPGDWQGAYVALPQVNVAKLVRETRGK